MHKKRPSIRLIPCLFWITFSTLTLTFNACFPPTNDNEIKLNYEYSDPLVIQILEAKDRRHTDTLISFLQHENPAFRLLACQAFASVRDTLAIPALIQLLKDPIEAIRKEAVISLGQIGHIAAETALIAAFIPVDSIGPYLYTNAAILEALGKCGSDSTLAFLCGIKSYTARDTVLLKAQMLGIYRFGLREKYNEAATPMLVNTATKMSFPDDVRLVAAHCLQRFKTIELGPYFEVLKKSCIEEKNPDIRMCLVTALCRTKNSKTLQLVEELYSRGLDVRVQSNLLRGLSNLKNGSATSFAIRAAQNPSIHVSLNAAEYLAEFAPSDYYEELKNLSEQSSLPWQVRSVIFRALLQRLPDYLVLTNKSVNERLKWFIHNAKSPYEKSAYIKALKESTRELWYVLSLDDQNLPSIVKTSIAETIESILNKADFYFIYKGNRNAIYPYLSKYFEKQCQSADAGTVAIMASVFMKNRGILNKYVRPDSILLLAQEKLKLPRDIETWNEIQKTLDKLNGKKFVPRTLPFNHPIVWSLLPADRDTISIQIITDKGEMGLELYPKEAPGSVANFLKLTRDSFYNGKIFHRVVPNFVVQVGCPRGDGYGGLDYTIRTEISDLNYLKSGMMGMASAGPDTEGTQFFITHSPSPHLDGKYTIFGRLVEGMDVLLSIQQGDKIKEIKIKE